ncbi:class I SAM-dependent methyltransferase [Leptospira sp. WS92.C1]
MDSIRKPWTGVRNILWFNWPFYVFSFAGMIVVSTLLPYFIDERLYVYCFVFSLFIFTPIFLSLVVSWYVYDLSDLYRFNWLEDREIAKTETIVNIHAGFDETSHLLETKFPNSELYVMDFYDPKQHTAASIQRARTAYPRFPGTKTVTTTRLPLEDRCIDKIFAILSVHEIRSETERIVFFGELNRILKSDGQIFVVEHLRDLPNFLAYNIGFLHFYSRKSWENTIQMANLKLKEVKKITPFLTIFKIEKNGTTS